MNCANCHGPRLNRCMPDNSFNDLSGYRKAFLLIVGAALLSGISGVIIKLMSIPATSMAWLRMTTPTIILGVYLVYHKRRIFKKGYKIMLLGSAFNATRMFFYFVAFIYTSISNAIIVVYTWPIFATILSAIFLKEKISTRQIILLMSSFGGILFIYGNHDFSFSNEHFIGLTAGVLAAFFYSCSIIIFKSQTSSFSPFETIFFQNSLGVLVFLPFFLTNTPAPQPLDWTLGITHGVVIGIIMFGMFFLGLRKVKASTASIITYLEIIVAISLSILVMDEQLSLQTIIGAVIIIGSTLLLRKEKSP